MNRTVCPKTANIKRDIEEGWFVLVMLQKRPDQPVASAAVT